MKCACAACLPACRFWLRRCVIIFLKNYICTYTCTRCFICIWEIPQILYSIRMNFKIMNKKLALAKQIFISFICYGSIVANKERKHWVHEKVGDKHKRTIILQICQALRIMSVVCGFILFCSLSGSLCCLRFVYFSFVICFSLVYVACDHVSAPAQWAIYICMFRWNNLFWINNYN